MSIAYSHFNVTMNATALRLAEYVRQDGACPYTDWFDRLDSQAAAKVATATLRLSMGNTSNLKWLGGIGELKIDWGAGYRVYLGRDDDRVIVLFGGGTKRTQNKDIQRARALHAEFKTRKATLTCRK